MRGWDHIFGQDRPKLLLQRAVERSRVHHGYLFVGPTGVGKRATALAFAQLLNCVTREDGAFAAACGRCASCHKFENDLQHPDLHLIEPSGGVNKSIKIDDVRAVQRVAMTRPYEGRWQVVIFDDAHLMTEQAANALLKTLEEPPDSMRLFLVTDQPQALIDTIRSRCQTLRFGALDEALIAQVLRDGDGEAYDAGVLAAAARYGEGSPGRASALLESELLEERGELLELLDVARRSHPDDLLSRAEKMSKDRAQLGARLEVLSALLRDVLFCVVGVPRERLLNVDLADRIAAIATKFDADAVMTRAECVRVARELLTRNVNGGLVLEHLATELAPGPARPPIQLPRLAR